MPFTALTYPTAQAFLERARPFLEEQEAVNNRILGIAARLVDHPDWEDFPFFLSTVENGSGQVVLAAMMTPPKQIALAGASSTPREAVEVLAGCLASNRWQPPGVTGPTDVAAMFAEAWAQANGLEHRVTMNQRVYELRAVNPVPSCPGYLRPAQEPDLETVAAWRSAFFAEAFEPGGTISSLSGVNRRIAAGEVYLWDDHGPVSMAVQTRSTRNGASIGGVYTPPEQRRKGYATSLVAALSSMILASGKQFCSLFTDLSNPTSNDIYMKIGYVPLCDFTSYRFEVL